MMLKPELRPARPARSASRSTTSLHSQTSTDDSAMPPPRPRTSSSSWTAKVARRTSASFDNLLKLRKQNASDGSRSEDDDVLHIHRSAPASPLLASTTTTPGRPAIHGRSDTLASDMSRYSNQETYSETLNLDAYRAASRDPSPSSSSANLMVLPAIPVDESMDLDPSTPIMDPSVPLPASRLMLIDHGSTAAMASRPHSVDESPDPTSILSAYLPLSASPPVLSSPDGHASSPVESPARRSHFREPAMQSPSIATAESDDADPYSADVDVGSLDILKEIDDAISRSRQTSSPAPVDARDRSMGSEVEEIKLIEPTGETDEVEALLEADTSTGAIRPPSERSASAPVTTESSRPKSAIEPRSNPTSPVLRHERRRSLFSAREASARGPFSPHRTTSVHPQQLDLSLCSRKRPLPRCLDYTEVTRLKTPGERAIAYARKTQEILAAETGLQVWMSWMKSQQHQPPVDIRRSTSPRHTRSASGSGSTPSKPGHARYEPSIEFPMRQNDLSRAQDITNRHPTPTSFVPTSLPYPGALPHRSSFSSLSSIASGQSILLKGDKNSFLSIARRASTRHKLSNKTISGPIPMSSSIEEDPPYRPALATPPATLSRAPAPSGPRSSSAIPTMAPPRSSMSLPLTPTFSNTSSGSQRSAYKAEDVLRVAQCLPQASQEDIESCLSRSDADVMAAISLYLREHK